MNNRNSRRKNYSYYRNKKKKAEITQSKLGVKVFISLVLLLSVLLFKKYDVRLGEFSVDTIYEVLYYNEDFNALSNKVFKIDNSAFRDIFNITSGE